MSDHVPGAGGAGPRGAGPSAGVPRGGFLLWALKAVGVLAGMLLAAGTGVYVILLVTIRGHEVIVPDLTGKTQAEAEAEARGSQLEIEVAGSRIEPRIAEGRVFDQEPRPGARTRPTRAIKVLLSAGQGSLEVPSLVGNPLRKAQLSL